MAFFTPGFPNLTAAAPSGVKARFFLEIMARVVSIEIVPSGLMFLNLHFVIVATISPFVKKKLNCFCASRFACWPKITKI